MSPDPAISDERLMRRFAERGDTAAFDELVVRHTRGALAVARRLLGDEALAEDVVQEAFLRVVRARDRYQAGRPFGPWFYTIVRRVAVDTARRRARDRRAAAEAARWTDGVEGGPADGERVSVEEMLAPLPEGERTVLVLRVVEGLSFREVAAALGLSVEAAKKRAQRGLARLRRRHRRKALAS